MKSTIVKRSIVVAGHITSVSLEDVFWDGVRAICRQRNVSLTELLGEIDRSRRGNLSSAIRVFVLRHYVDIASQDPRPLGRAEEKTVSGAEVTAGMPH